jgi:hypothetical protein
MRSGFACHFVLSEAVPTAIARYKLKSICAEAINYFHKKRKIYSKKIFINRIKNTNSFCQKPTPVSPCELPMVALSQLQPAYPLPARHSDVQVFPVG